MIEPAFITALREPYAYPHACSEIRLVETHISWVFLTGDYAYKLKKPVDFGFLDFGTLDKRRFYCEEECRCNSRFAPELYLGTVAIRVDTDGEYHVGGGGRIVEYAVKMRQFDDDRQLDRMLERDALSVEMLVHFANHLATIYAGLPEIPAVATDAHADSVLQPVRENFRVLRELEVAQAHSDALDRIQVWVTSTHSRLYEAFGERARHGWIRECHGDLHLSNLVQTDLGIRAFDCIEFNPKLREIDIVNDIAFLFMDCAVRGRSDLAYGFIDGYLEASADYSGARLLRFYAVYRSLVRAKVAALRLSQSPDKQAERKLDVHIAWARRMIEPDTGAVVLMCGPSGSGKSWLAERLAPQLPAIRVRSDIVRRELSGLGRTAPSGSELGGGIYSPAVGAAVYARLLKLTRQLNASGEVVIVDATFLAATDRAAFQVYAAARGCACVVVQCEAPRPCLEQRVVARRILGEDPSEATLEVLHQQLETYEAPGPGESTIRVRTDRDIDVPGLVARILEDRRK